MRFIQKSAGFLLLIAVAVYLTGCMSTKLPDAYQVDPEVLEAKGGQVDFAVTGTIPQKSFHKKAVVEFTPYVKYGEETKELKKFVLRGEKTEGEGTVINSKTGGSFTYNDTFEYTDDMYAAELMVNATVTKGKKVQEFNDIKLADGIIATYQGVVHDEKTILAPSGYEKVTIVSEIATIYFQQNKSNINWNLKHNKSDQSKETLANMEEFLMKGWEVKDVNIDGWASPEGEIDFNTNLADDRAASVNKYMEKKFQSVNKKLAKERGVAVSEVEQEVAYNAKGHGEDWDGFMAAVKDSELKDKNTIANVINSQPDAVKREQEIRNMTVIYEEVETEILPGLRRAEIIVNCYEPKRTDAEIAELATSYPDSLTYKELLHAATLTEDHQAKFNIYKAGFTHESRDWKTYNNAGAEAIELGNIDEAENLLNQAIALSENNGKILNNIGVIASHREDYATAEQYFLDAQKAGEDVSYNLGIIAIQKGEYQKALSYFSSIDCKHNVGLAQMLSGKMNEAMRNLKCAPESCKSYYMLAVYGARTDNSEMVYDYLLKAFEINPKAKAHAKEDREFVKYFGEADFQNLVN